MIQKIDPYYYRNSDPLVVEYIRRLENIADEYDDLISDEDTPIGDAVDIPKFRINTEAWDMAKMEYFCRHRFGRTPFNNLDAVLKYYIYFSKPGHKYDFQMAILMLYAYPLDSFTIISLREFMGRYGIKKATVGRLVNLLVENNYIGIIKKNKSDIINRVAFFLTLDGKKAVRDFIAEVSNEELNIDFYEKNLRWVIREAQGPRRKKSTLIKRHEDIFGEPAPSRFKRKKSRNGDSDNNGQEQQVGAISGR